jgi:hypothetical protein
MWVALLVPVLIMLLVLGMERLERRLLPSPPASGERVPTQRSPVPTLNPPEAF